MSDIAIRAEHLGKRYRIGGQLMAYKTLRESLVHAAGAPVRWLRGERRDENTFWALDDVSFEIKRSEAVGVIGRNGAGKSTLLKILSRITKPTRGEAELFGRVSSLLEVGTGFHPELTGRENIFLNGAILGMSRTEIMHKFDEIVDFAEVEKFLDTQVKFYSSGMYVRLAFAVAAHLEPEILLVDEVLAVGDAAFQRKSLDKMSSSIQAGRTVVFISHNMNAISQFCKTCILLDKGKIVTRGLARDVIQYYLASGDANNAVVNIHPDKHVHKTLGLEFNKISISSKGNLTNHIAYGNPIEVTCEFEITKAIEEARIGLVISTGEGFAICSLHEPNFEENSRPVQKIGQYVWNLKVDLPLMPGGYVIDLFAKPWPGYWGSGHASYDWVQGALMFHIEELSEDNSKSMRPSGVINPTFTSTIVNV